MRSFTAASSTRIRVCGANTSSRFRFYAFALQHSLTFAANAFIVCCLVARFGVVGTWRIAISLVGIAIYCTILAWLDDDLRQYLRRYPICRFSICIFLGATQLMQLKLASDKYKQRENQRRGLGNGPSALEENAIPSKKFEGIVEGAFFAMFCVWVHLIVDWGGNQEAEYLNESRGRNILSMLSGGLSFLTVGTCMLNFDYHINSRVAQTVDASPLYTVIHITFRCAEACQRIYVLVLWDLNFGVCADSWLRAIPRMIVIGDYILCVLLQLFAPVESRFTVNRSSFGFIMACLLAGTLSLLVNPSEFFGPQSEDLARAKKYVSRTLRTLRFVEFVTLIVLLLSGCPCKSVDLSRSNAHHTEYITFLSTLLHHSHFALALVPISTVTYYVLLFLFCRGAFDISWTQIDTSNALSSTYCSDVSLPVLGSNSRSNEVAEKSPHVMQESHSAPLLSQAQSSGDCQSFYCTPWQPRGYDLAPRSMAAYFLAKGTEKAFARRVLRGLDLRCARHSDFEIRDELGSGRIGTVYQCKEKSSGSILAMKCIRSCPGDLDIVHVIFKEREALLKAGFHPNIASLHYAFQEDDEWFLILEYCDCGSLRNFMAAYWLVNKQPFLRTDEAKSIGMDILEGLGHLHALGILHRDLKLDNIGISLECIIVSGAHPNCVNGQYRRSKDTKHSKEVWINTADAHYRIQCQDGAWSIQNLHGEAFYRCENQSEILGESYESVSDWIPCQDGQFSKPVVKFQVVAKLLDFSHAKYGVGTTLCGTAGFAPPEMMQSSIDIPRLAQSPHIDLYSFGVVLFVLLTGERARHDDTWGSSWSHKEFREMLISPNAELWGCAAYRNARISGHEVLSRMRKCGALTTISKLTEDLPSKRVLTTSDAKRLAFFRMHGDSAADVDVDDTDIRIQNRLAASLQWALISGRLKQELDAFESRKKSYHGSGSHTSISS